MLVVHQVGYVLVYLSPLLLQSDILLNNDDFNFYITIRSQDKTIRQTKNAKVVWFGVFMKKLILSDISVE